MITAFSFFKTVGFTGFKMKDTFWYHCVFLEVSKPPKPGSGLSWEIAGMAPSKVVGVFYKLRENVLSSVFLLC